MNIQDITSPNISYNVIQQLVNQSKIGVAQLRINQESNENQFTFAIGYSCNQQCGSNPVYSNGLNFKLGTDQKTLTVNTGTPDSNGTISNKNILFDSSNNYYLNNAIFYPQNIYNNQQSNSLSYQTQIISQYLKQTTSGFLFNSNIIFDTLNQQFITANFGTLTYVGNVERGLQYTSNGILQTSSNIVWDYNTNRMGINTNTPQNSIDVKGNISTNQQNIAQQLVSTLSSSDNSNQAIIVQNSNMIQNLNTQFFQGLTPSYFRNINNVNSGILPVVYGGTGLNYISNGQIIFGQGVSTSTSPNLFWDNTNTRLGINTSNPQYTVDVAGNVNVQQGLQVIGLNVTQSGMIGSNLVINSNLTVGATGTINQITATNIQVVNTATSLSNVSSNETVNSNLNVGNNLQVANQITTLSNVSSNSIITSNLVVGNQVTSLSNLTTNEIINSNLNVGLNVSIGNNLQVSNQITSLSNLTTNETINSNLIVRNQITSLSNLTTNQTINSNLIVGNNTTIGSSLSVINKVTSLSNVTTNETINSNLSVGINTMIGCNLQVSNQITSLSILTTNGTINSNLTVNNLLISTISTGTAPFNITSTTLVSNLNVQYLNGQPQAYYTNASNISSGTLNVAYGGTGTNTVSNGYLFYASNNVFAQNSNLYYNASSNFFGINNNNPAYPLDVIGNTQIKGNLIVNGQIYIVGSNTSTTQTGTTGSSTGQTTSTTTTSTGSTNTSILPVSNGGTGLSNSTPGQLLFGQDSNQLGQSSNLFWDVTNLRLGVKTFTPQYQLDVIGSIQCSCNLITSNQIISLISTGTAPLQVSSTTLISNLNVQFLNSQQSSYYTNASNISSGILAAVYGGTGLSTLTQGYIPFGQGSNALGSTCNLYWNNISNYLGIGTTSPSNAIDVVGNIRVSSNIISFNQFVSTVAVGTAPLSITSSTLVTNLNVQYLNGQSGYYYTNASSISSGILSVSYGGTGLTTLTQGYIPFGQGSNTLGCNSNLCWNNTFNYLGVGTTTPSNSVDVVGNIRASSNIISSNQFVSTVAVGTAPLSVTSTTLVQNLNVQYLNGQPASYYTNTFSGTVTVSQGGTGITTLTSGYIPFGQGSNPFSSSSNLFWNSTSNYLGINNSSPSNSLDVIGNTYLKGNLTVTGNISIIGASGSSGSSSTILPVMSGGTGLSNVTQGYLPFGQGQNSLGLSSNLFWDSTNLRLGIRNSNPQQAIDVVGNINCSSNIYLSNQLVSTITVGTSPFSVASTTLVTNLNAQYLNNLSSSYFTNATNISSGILGLSYGGTGLSQITSGYIPIGNGNNALNISSNLFFDVNSNNFGLGTTTPINDIHIQSTSTIHPIIGLVNTAQSSFIQISSSQSIPQISSSTNGLSLGYTPAFTSNQSNYTEVCRINQSGLTTTNISFTNPPNFSSLYQFYYNSNQTASSSVQLFNSKASLSNVGNSFTFTSASNTITTNYTGYVQFNSQIFATYTSNTLTTPTYLLSVLKNSNSVYQISTSNGYTPLPLQFVSSCSSNDVFQIAFTITNGTLAILGGSVVGVNRLY